MAKCSFLRWLSLGWAKKTVSNAARRIEHQLDCVKRELTKMRRRTIPTARITQAGIGIRRGLAGFVAAATLLPCAEAQQPQCLNGILSLPGDVNGRIEVCGTLASQVPGL